MSAAKGYRVAYDPTAWRQLEKLSEAVQWDIHAAVEALENNPRPSGCKKLEDKSGFYRVRVGNYRIIYDVQDAVLLVLVVKVGDRRAVYKKKK